MAAKKSTKKKSAPQKSAKKSNTPKKSGGFPKSIMPEEGFGKMLQGKAKFIFGFLVFLISLFLFLSFVSYLVNGWKDQAGLESVEGLQEAHNWAGTLGASTAQYFIDDCFGVCAFFIPMFLVMLSMKLMEAYKVRLWKWFLNFSILMIWGSVALSIASLHFFPETWNDVAFKWGGGHGDLVSATMQNAVGLTLSIIILIAIAIGYLIYLTDETIDVVRQLFNPKDLITNHLPERLKEKKNEDEAAQSADIKKPLKKKKGDAEEEGEEYKYGNDLSSATQLQLMGDSGKDAYADVQTEPLPEELGDEEPVSAEKDVEIQLDIAETPKDQPEETDEIELATGDAPYDPRKDLEFYKFPSPSLLKKYEEDGPAFDMQEQTANKDRIVAVLQSFGVEISAIKATIGPTITLYEVTPAPGVRISKIRNLEDDIALSLSALGIRIIAPIPGKGTIGIEVPNKNPKIVSMESLITSKRFQNTSYDLPIALGKTITNEVFMVDLAKMPHLLVAGATGQGKSVGLNAIITSLLYKKHPAELKFVMVDPKKVELSIYASIEKHYLAKLPENDDPIITDVTKVVQTLKSLCQLMDHRYDMLKKAQVRNIKEYNQKFQARQLNPEHGHEYMPYIVIVIDEFGDLIMVAGKEVELPIARIAQLARAVGMHMVIATQRPTTNIITGTIKANFPARMAFKVMSVVDSRTILDRTGANQLVGRGDMLFLSSGEPVRVQCAFVDTPEVRDISNFIAEQQSYPCAYELPEPLAEDGGGAEGGGLDKTNLDPMFAQSARLIVQTQQGSTSLIQRRLSLGYNRAGRIMEQLERAGIVGPARGAKPREVFITDETSLENLLNTLVQA